MGSVVVVATRKGGAGKTTTCCILAGAVAQRGHSVGVVDADYNHSLANWLGKFPLPNVELHRPVDDAGTLDDARIYSLVSDLKDKHDLVVVDTPGAASRSAIYAMAQADLVLVPMMLSDADVTEAINTFSLIDDVRTEAKKIIPARGLLNAYTPRTAVAAHVEEQLKAQGLPMLSTKLQALTAFREMTHNGAVPLRWAAGRQVYNLLYELAELDALPFLDRSRFGLWWRRSA